MTRASVPTLLSLDRWARILTINPVHFSGASGSLIWPSNGACAEVWPQYSWQTAHELVGRDDINQVIATVEQDFKDIIGYSVGPTWEVDESQRWRSNGTGYLTQVKTEYGMVIAPGRRAVTLIEADAPVVRSNPDGDTWDELATVTVSTDLTDIREIKVYYAGHDGDEEWEIRPRKSVTIAGGVATITLDAWQLIDPDLWERYPTNEGFLALDITNAANFVTEVDVYREYNDTSQSAADFYTMGSTGGLCGCGGVGCQACEVASGSGCFRIHDTRLGFITPFPATYGESGWRLDRLNYNYALRVSLSYYAGEMDKRYITRKSLDPLSQEMAEAIVWCSVARLPNDFCSCNNIRERIKTYQMSAVRMREGAQNAELYTRYDKLDVYSCPLGERVGEVMAWQRLSRVKGALGDGGAL